MDIKVVDNQTMEIQTVEIQTTDNRTADLEAAGGAIGHACLALQGRFDAFEAEAFRTVLNGLLESDTTTIGIDLSKVRFIDSSALAELVRGMKRCREAGGDLYLIRPSNPVTVILELTRLDVAFEIDPAGD